MNGWDLRIRCQRCGEWMEMRDPAPEGPWAPDQFWVCPRCGRHFWTTYPPPKKEVSPQAASDQATPEAAASG
jgi:ribosomal protein L37E